LGAASGVAASPSEVAIEPSFTSYFVGGREAVKQVLAQ
jgi:hypothetical protein